jgi:hypothetical protein
MEIGCIGTVMLHDPKLIESIGIGLLLLGIAALFLAKH